MITSPAPVDVTTATSGKREYSSMMSRK